MYYPKNKIVLTLSIVVFFSLEVFSQTIASDSMEQKKGSTRSKGSFKVYVNASNVKIEFNFNVRKSGTSGTGKGAYGFEILNESFEPIFKVKKGLTVGANSIKGKADKNWKKTITITGSKAKQIRNGSSIFALSVITQRDDIGLPSSISEWKRAIKDMSEVIKLSSGESLISNGWKFSK